MSLATIILLSVAAAVLALHLYRQYWTYRDLPQMHTHAFPGELFRVGRTYIARRPARGGSRRSIVCFPGFLEDMCYFQALYEDCDCELLLVNNANYHCPFLDLEAQPLSWPENPHALGSIEHDGFYLARIVEELARGSEIVLHGHSRGGAVVLAAGRLAPALMRSRSVSAILEAPVLPQGKTFGRSSKPIPNRLICYFMPLALGVLRRSGPGLLLKMPMMRPTNPLKTRLCHSFSASARNYSTCVVNVRDIVDWQRNNDIDLYNNYPRIAVVIGARDDVLDRATMLASAEAGAALNEGVSIVHTEDTNHFITLEQPHYLRTLARIRARC